jgi:hypothetical protein
VAPPRGAPDVAAVVVPSRDRFADPPALAVRADALARVGGPEPVRGGALADLVDRLEAAGHIVERRAHALPPRPATVRALRREGAARFWLWRRRPGRHPRPRPAEVGWWAYPILALGALRANGDPTAPGPGALRANGDPTPPAPRALRANGDPTAPAPGAPADR